MTGEAEGDQWRDIEQDVHEPPEPAWRGPCPYADPDEERRRHERAKHSGTDPC